MNRLRSWLVLTQNFTIKHQLRLAQSRSYQSTRRSNLEREDVQGVYNVILPAEPFVFGVDHIQPRAVPDHIARPPYARTGSSVPLQDNEKINLGGESELRIREAALLAKKVREFAGTQVKVRAIRLRHPQKTPEWLQRIIMGGAETDFNTFGPRLE